MIFENTQLDLTQLPSLETVGYQKLEKDYLKVSYYGRFITWLVILGLLLSGITMTGFLFTDTKIALAILSLGFVLAVLSFWALKKGFDIKGFYLREKDISFREGLIFRSITTIPFNRIQHCEITQGPIERRYHLKTLQVFTAGGQSSDLTIPGLKEEEAERLKEFITQQTSISKDEIIEVSDNDKEHEHSHDKDFPEDLYDNNQPDINGQ